MADPSNQPTDHKQAPTVTPWLLISLLLLGLLFTTSLITAFLWSIAQVPTCALAGLALIFSGFLIKGREWARNALLIVVLVQLAVAVTTQLALGLLLPLLLEGATSAWLIALLVGKPSSRKAWLACGGVVVTVVAGGYLTFAVSHSIASRPGRIDAGERLQTYMSPSKYQLHIGGLPWMALGRQEAASLLGADIENADLRLIRDDGTGFALFFPLQFRNMAFTPEISMLLQREIQEKWLKELVAWKHHAKKDGFILTAQGNGGGIDLTYVVMYKHFGNLGVYAILWGERKVQGELLAEGTLFYDQLSAAPIKDRLGKLTPSEIYRQFSDAVVLINVYDEEHELLGQGSGFNIAGRGLILTNLHVALPGHYLEVVFPSGDIFDEVRIAALSQHGADLALLAIDGAGLPAIQQARTVPVDPGDPVYVLGNPKGLVNSVSQGIVGAVREEKEIVYYQITAPISVGSSGGPVFNEFGEVIGVATALVEDAQNLNFSISIDEVEHLAFLPIPITLLQLREELEAYQREKQ